VASMHYPFLPVRLILRDRWDNVAALATYAGPKAVLVAGRDEVVSAAQGDLLFEKLVGPKRRWFSRTRLITTLRSNRPPGPAKSPRSSSTRRIMHADAGLAAGRALATLRGS
jgi:hypothetical protein